VPHALSPDAVCRYGTDLGTGWVGIWGWGVKLDVRRRRTSEPGAPLGRRTRKAVATRENACIVVAVQPLLRIPVLAGDAQSEATPVSLPMASPIVRRACTNPGPVALPSTTHASTRSRVRWMSTRSRVELSRTYLMVNGSSIADPPDRDRLASSLLLGEKSERWQTRFDLLHLIGPGA
jgi:hypothetical protein